MLCQIHKKTVSNSPLISNRMKKRNIFSWNLFQTISVISPPSPATPPIRGRYKSGAVPAYLDSPGTPAYWSLTVHTAVEKSRYRGGWWRRGNDAGHCCVCWSLLCKFASVFWSLLCKTRSASNQLCSSCISAVLRCYREKELRCCLNGLCSWYIS